MSLSQFLRYKFLFLARYSFSFLWGGQLKDKRTRERNLLSSPKKKRMQGQEYNFFFFFVSDRPPKPQRTRDLGLSARQRIKKKLSERCNRKLAARQSFHDQSFGLTSGPLRGSTFSTKTFGQRPHFLFLLAESLNLLYLYGQEKGK